MKYEKKTIETSSGGVIFYYCNETNAFYFLLIQNRSASQHWSFPKGHVEKGETFKETSNREIKEETGLINFEVLDELDHVL